MENLSLQAIGQITEPLTHGRGETMDITPYAGQHLSGYSPHRSQARNRRCLEAARLFADVITGRAPRVLLQEAMNPTQEFMVDELKRRYPGIFPSANSGRNILGLQETMAVTDYQALYVDVLDRMYYGYYGSYPVVNKVLCKVHSLRDFRTVKRYLYDGMVTPMLPIDPAAQPSRATRDLFGPTPQNGATLGPSTSTAAITYAPTAYAAGTAINWQAFVNDDLGIFNDVSSRLAMAGTRAIAKFITQQFFDVNGPHASLYTSGYKNIINIANGASANNPPLDAQGISDALKILSGMVDAGGDPIMVGGKAYLVYGPAYTAAAQNLKRSLTIQLSVEGGTANAQGFPSQFAQVENWIMNDLELVLDPYIPLVSTANKKSWALVLDPNGLSRPSVELGFLSGFETPQMYRKMPNTLRVDGGVETMMGDFYSMDQETKIVGVWGSAQIDGRSTVGSNGSGT